MPDTIVTDYFYGDESQQFDITIIFRRVKCFFAEKWYINKEHVGSPPALVRINRTWPRGFGFYYALFATICISRKILANCVCLINEISR